MEDKDVRWKQRFHNYSKAVAQLQKFIDHGELNELEEQGLIKAFEYTYELAWKTIKDFYEYQGEPTMQGSRDTFKTVAARGLIQNGDAWMQMLTSRDQTSHGYDEATADEISRDILTTYHPLFIQLQPVYRLNI